MTAHYIKPATRGSVTEAIDSNTLSYIAPESPRPLEMLDSVEITSADILTADDAALHELLISAAYEADKEMSSEFTSLPVSTALKFLGEHARRDALKTSMRRLASTTVSYGNKKSRRFENVPLLFSYLESTESEDVIKYALPEPIRILMRSMPSYAYLELAPLSQMKSKYSVRIYRVLAAAAARKKWVAGEDNRVVVSASLRDLYNWSGFPLDSGKMSFGKFRQRVLNSLENELATVRRFSLRIDEIRKASRGRPLERIDFILNIRAPSHKLTHVSFEKGHHKTYGYGGVDAPEFRVNSHIWQKAQKEFWSVQKRHHSTYFSAWQIALREALEQDEVSPGYAQRAYRGHRLLNAINSLGADEAAFQFCAEEVANPDLLADENTSLLEVEIEPAIEARKQRIESKKPFVRPAFLEEPAATDAGIKLLEELVYDLEDIILPTSKPKPEIVEIIEKTDEFDELLEVPATAEDLGVDELTAARLEELLKDDEEEEKTDVDLSKIREIIWTADRELSYEEVEEYVFPIIQNIIFDGEYNVEITVRCWRDGITEELSFGKQNITLDDVNYITKTLAADRLLDDDINEPEFII